MENKNELKQSAVAQFSAQVAEIPKKVNDFGKGGDTEDPDIVAFAHASYFTAVVVAVVLLTSFWLWRGQPHVLFAVPEFPHLGVEDCEAIKAYADLVEGNNFMPPADVTAPSIAKLYMQPNGTLDAAAMEAECQYNLKLYEEYNRLRIEMEKLPDDLFIGSMVAQSDSEPDAEDLALLYPSDANMSVKGLLKNFVLIVSLLGLYVYWVFWHRTRRELNPLREAYKKARKELDEALKAFDAATDSIQREHLEARKLEARKEFKEIHDKLTAKDKFNSLNPENVFLALSMAALSYLAIDVLWFFIGRSLSQPLIYETETSILFVAVLVGVYAFLYFSWIIKLEITDLSLFAASLLLVGLIVGMLLTNHIWNIGITNAYSTMSEHAYPERLSYEVAGTLGSRGVFRLTFIGTGLLFAIYSVYLSKKVRKVQDAVSFISAKDAKRMSPSIILWTGIIASIFMAFVGLFPLDGFAVPDENIYRLHMTGAFLAPVIFVWMMLTYWFIGYPKSESSDKFLPTSSYIWFSISSVAMLWYMVGRYFSDTSEMSNLYLALGLGALIIFAVYAANRWHSGKWNWVWDADNKYSPLLHWAISIVLGTGLGIILPDKMTTVTSEFIILLVFTLFIYSYSKYLVEYEANAAEENIPTL
jgi:hypothetical protein